MLNKLTGTLFHLFTNAIYHDFSNNTKIIEIMRKTLEYMNKANLEPQKQTFISFNQQQKEESNHS